MGEAWGLNLHDLAGVLAGAPLLQQRGPPAAEHVRDLFLAFDTDMNGLVDALELMVGLGLMSGNVISYSCYPSTVF